jgi:hypothetical protein
MEGVAERDLVSEGVFVPLLALLGAVADVVGLWMWLIV